MNRSDLTRCGLSQQLLLNAAQIQIPDKDLTVWSTVYRDHDQLRQLRQDHRGNYVFKRRGNHIEAVAVSSNASQLNWSNASVNATQAYGLVSALTMEAFLAYAHQIQRPSRSYDPVTIPTKSSILQSVPGGEKVPDWMRVRSRFVVSTRLLWANQGSHSPSPFLVLNIETSRD